MDTQIILDEIQSIADQVFYDQLFYELPPKTHPPKHATVETFPAGTYVEVDFEGKWETVGLAYDALTNFAAQKELPQPIQFYEVAQMRLLGTDPINYRCRISAPISRS